MIYLLLEGHDFKYDLYNLVKVFFPTEELKVIEKKEEYLGENFLIIVSLIEKEESLYGKAKFYINDNLIKEYEEDINLIEIYSDNREKSIKTGLRKALFSLLEHISKVKTPWGILTGIRPVKIVHDLMAKGIEDTNIIITLTDQYRLEKEKANLLLGIGKKQEKYIYPIDANKYSLYISIPFCPTRCLYCSFPSLSILSNKEYVEEYTSTIIYEIQEIKKLMEGKDINTVYIGGGTPTALPQDKLERIIQSIYINFGENNIKEFTVEAGRPDTITLDYLKMLKENNIERISINPQTMNNKTLKLVGRNHSVEDIFNVSYTAKDMGFESINMDLIIGLPGEGLEEVKNTLKQIKKIDPENLTIHTLSLKTGSRLKSTLEKYPMEKQQVLKSMFKETERYGEEMNLYPYYLYRQKRILGNLENIGYCKEDKECIYNISMMEEKETIIGAGMGAVSKIYFPEENKIKRVPNFKDLKEYITRKEELIDKKRKELVD